MNPSSSFISSFDRPVPRSRRRRQLRVVKIVFWTIGILVLLDAVIGFVFRMPANVHQPPSALQAYFEHGRSIEGKLQRMIGPTIADDAPIVNAGWIGKECDRPSSAAPGKLGIDIYGMSFSADVAEQMERLDSGVALNNFAGPAAPLNHSYACFLEREKKGLVRMPVQIVGVLGSSLLRMHTIDGLTTGFEAPQPFTYPRYSLAADGHLVAHWPIIRTQQDLHEVFADPAKWQTFLHELTAEDDYYRDILMRSNVFDRSVIVRMLRRAWAQRFRRERTDTLGMESGFSGAPDIPPTLNAMLLDIQKRCLAAKARLVVLLIEDRGYEGVFSRITVPSLKRHNIDYVITSKIAPTSDSNTFISDGHFTDAVNAKIAKALLALLGRPQ